MLKLLFISIVTLAVLLSCSDKTKNKKNIPNYVTKVIDFFDSSRLKEFDTISFAKTVNWANYYWRVADKEHICYEYRIGYPDRVSNEYKFPKQDSLERIRIFDQEKFKMTFPLGINLPDDNIDMTLSQNGLIDCRISWMNGNYDENNDMLYDSLVPNSIFSGQNPFEYFRSRNKTLDSLGIHHIIHNSTGNFITIVMKQEEHYLVYLPNNLFVEVNYQKKFDSIMSTGYRIDKNWVWKKKKRL